MKGVVLPTLYAAGIAALALTTGRPPVAHRPPPSTFCLAWDPYTNICLRVVACTNLLNGNWQPKTNLYPVWPTNVNVANALPQEYFKLQVVYTSESNAGTTN